MLGFCRERGIPVNDIQLVQEMSVDPDTGLVSDIRIDVQLPPGFPDRYREAVLRAADHCTVKRHFEHPPRIAVSASTAALSS